MNLRRFVEDTVLGVVDHRELDKREETRKQIERLQQANESWWNQIEANRQWGKQSPTALEAIRSNNEQIARLQSQL